MTAIEPNVTFPCPLTDLCMRKGCDRLGQITLKVKFIAKYGIFCKECAADLLSGDLAVASERGDSLEHSSMNDYEDKGLE